jgi:hypothetical protein
MPVIAIGFENYFPNQEIDNIFPNLHLCREFDIRPFKTSANNAFDGRFPGEFEVTSPTAISSWLGWPDSNSFMAIKALNRDNGPPTFFGAVSSEVASRPI